MSDERVPEFQNRPNAQIRVLSDGVLGMLIFVLCEVMLFAGLISAFLIVKAGAPIWPPLDQPRLPVEATALNTLALLVSGWALWLAQRTFHDDADRAGRPLLAAILLGGFFVTFQGAEWLTLIGRGLTLTSSSLGGFFYLIVGMHALHAIVAIGVLVWVYRRLRAGTLIASQLQTAMVLWLFVVAIWPVLYLEVYL